MGFTSITAKSASFSPRSVTVATSFFKTFSPMQMAIESQALEVQTQSPVFEASIPDTSVLVGLGIVVILCVFASVVWANEVVPVSRAKLAVSKSRGEVREYLDSMKTDKENDRRLEKWLFSDWLNNGRIKKDSAIPFLKEAKWNSGDNPVLVTCALMGIGVIVASFTERVSSGSPLI